MFDYGHGGRDFGAVFGERKEAHDVLKLGRAVATVVRAAGITVDETRTHDTTLTLADRSNMERKKKYDYFISFHRYAANSKLAHGVECLTYITKNPKARLLAEEIQKAMVRCGFRDCGIKTSNYHVLRETHSPAIIVEAGSITSERDNHLFDSRFNELVQGIAKAILRVIPPFDPKEKRCFVCGNLLN